MKTVKEMREYTEGIFHKDSYIKGYEKAIEGIIKDIKESGSISVESIEKYLQDLLK